MISSLQNDKIKLTHALQSMAKARRKEGKIVLEGVRLVRDALQADHTPLFALIAADFDDDSVLQPLRAKGVETLPVSDEIMRHVSATQQPQGVLAVFPMPEPTLPPIPQRILILDSLRDPGNMGTILRTAGAAGVQAVLLSPTCADPYNPKALRSGMGAHFRVPVIEMEWERIASYIESLQMYIADSAGDVRYDQVEWSKAWALIIGSEAHGAGSEARSLAQQRIYIPMAASTESLNAAVAAGIILFEAARQP
jgi:RNA methyltransferase, TrmH family